MNTRFSKPILILAIVSLLSAGSILAGNGNNDGSGNRKAGGQGGADTEWNGGPAHKMARMSEKFGLDENQENAFLEFFRNQEAQRADMQARIMAQFGDEICEQRELNQAAFEEMLGGMLDAEQLALHEEMKANRQTNQGNRQGGRGNGRLECPAIP